MRRVSFIIVAAAMFMAMGCEEVIVGPITDEPYISFHEDWMTLPAEGGEILVPLTSTGVDNVFIGNDSTSSRMRMAICYPSTSGWRL
ncbi:MAG: hypothetical protein IKJ48_00995 [Alistipes sp.]|nr:hypothetical protein [Alistipes sp.]